MRLFASILILSLTGALIFGGTQVSAAEKPQTQKSKTIFVKRGDTLSKIADGKKTTYKRIFNANVQIKNPDVIYPGQKLRIPAKNERLKDRFVYGSPVKKTAASPNYQTEAYNTPRTYTNTSSYNGGVWDKLAACESGGNWSINTGNGYYGGLQFTQSSWNAVGGSGSPANASKSEQIMRAKMLQSRQGWGAWPACSAKIGLR